MEIASTGQAFTQSRQEMQPILQFLRVAAAGQ